MSITIYHNPNCGTSRNVLAMIRQSGEEPVVVEYLKTPPTRERLKELIAAMRIPVRTLLREKGTPYAELGLADPKWTDDQLLDFMMAHPILINRPIVVTPKGVRLCRPSETVLDILPNPHIGRFVKEEATAVEYLKMLALSRLYLENIENIQSSWVTPGLKTCQIGLRFGGNDVGSIMIEENVVSAAGTHNRASEEELRRLIRDAGFIPKQRDTLYRTYFLN